MKEDIKITLTYMIGMVAGYVLGLRRGEQIGEMFGDLRHIGDSLYPHSDCVYKSEAEMLRAERKDAKIERAAAGIVGVIVGVLAMSILSAIVA